MHYVEAMLKRNRDDDGSIAKKQRREKKENGDDEEEMLFGNRMSLDEEPCIGGEHTYVIPDDNITADGKIDMSKKLVALRGNKQQGGEGKENNDEDDWYELKINQASKINQLHKQRGDQNKNKRKDNNGNEDKDLDKEDEYDYVFEKSNMIDFVPDIPTDEMKEIEEKIELEEMIEKEENRIKSMEEVRESLPVYKYKRELIDAVRDNQVLIVIGETGSGKTTQLPQYLYKSGYKSICCTQPRRVAAISVATRVADEMGTKLGDKVGYSVRFDDKSSRNTVIKYLTDGMLVREFMRDENIDRYSVVMVDEAHERTLHTDVVLGLLKKLLARRKDLRVVISSATINAQGFSDYFDGAPVFNVPGRTFPVEIYYTPHHEANYVSAAIAAVWQIHLSQPAGDVLVFLTGQDEIETVAGLLKEGAARLAGRPMVVCPLYAALPADQQRTVFEPVGDGGGRKVVLSTNIAETSVTIPGVVYVVDAGMVKERAVVNGVDSLRVVACSRASADQRSGRAGRVGPGKCFRLYTKGTYLEDMVQNSVPEILRTELTGTILQLLTMGVGDLVGFPFMDRPDMRALAKALELLYAWGALNERGEITAVGLKMAAVPTNPMLARCVVGAGEWGAACVGDVVTVVAMLEELGAVFVQGRGELREKARNAHDAFVKTVGALVGDHVMLLEVWRAFEESGRSSQWCRDHFVQYRTMGRVDKVRRQLLRVAARLDVAGSKTGAPDSWELRRLKMVRAFCGGCFVHSATLGRTGDGTYVVGGSGVGGNGQGVARIHPNSVVGRKGDVPPARVIFHELVQTSRAFLRGVQPVQGKWIEGSLKIVGGE